MNNQNNTMSVTGTGIAVAMALVVVLGFLLFGSQIFSIIKPVATTATSTTPTMTDQSNSQQNVQTGQQQATQPADASASAAPAGVPSGIPANVTQLMMKDDVVGTGATAKAGDSVTVQYVGMLTNGTVFDASKNHGTDGFTFKLGAGQVIKGWDEGVVGMKIGGTRTLVIPASLGYGAQAAGSIPPNSTLVFQVQLEKIQ